MLFCPISRVRKKTNKSERALHFMRERVNLLNENLTHSTFAFHKPIETKADTLRLFRTATHFHSFFFYPDIQLDLCTSIQKTTWFFSSLFSSFLNQFVPITHALNVLLHAASICRHRIVPMSHRHHHQNRTMQFQMHRIKK